MAVGTYVDFNVKFLLIFGFAFELPLALTLLARAGVVSATMLSRYRRHAIMAAVIVSAVITPDATLFTMLLMAVPLIILYEIGVVGARLFGRTPVPGSPETDESHLEGLLPTGTAGKRIK